MDPLAEPPCHQLAGLASHVGEKRIDYSTREFPDGLTSLTADRKSQRHSLRCRVKCEWVDEGKNKAKTWWEGGSGIIG